MSGQIPQPGVEVIQKFTSASPSFLIPTLVPCTVGPAFEVLNVLNTDGTINSKAKWGTYSQIPLSIAQSAYPDPRGNLSELDILEERVRTFMFAGGRLAEMPLTNGQAFLCTSHGAAKAAIRSVGFTTKVLDGKVLVIAIDQPVRIDTTKDYVITFDSDSAMTPQQVAAQINDQVGIDIAFVVGTSPLEQVELRSPTYGARSSITIRKGASANLPLHLGIYTDSTPTDNPIEERVEGAGFRAQDQSNNTTQSPWIEFYRGAYMQDGVEKYGALPGGAGVWSTESGLYNVLDTTYATFTSGKAAEVTFGSTPPALPIVAGDYFYADGTRVGSGEIARVEASRFKLGTINTELSTADENGNYLTKVYDAYQVGIVTDASPFIPSYCHFRANDLDWQLLTPTAANIKGSVSAASPVAGSITGSTAITTDVEVAGLTIHYVSVIEGVEYEGTFQLSGGPYSLANLVTYLNNYSGAPANGLTFSASGNFLKVTCSHSPASSRTYVIIKKDSTLGTVVGWSTTEDTTSSNQKDAEFTSLATKVLEFTLDQNPHVYSVGLSSNSIDVTVTDINRVVGAAVASKDDTGLKLVLTSQLKGLSSKVEVDSTCSAYSVLGFDTGGGAIYTAGTKRPYPDVYVDDALVMHVQAQILRDLVTGFPYDQLFNPGTLYIQYKALRKDVTAVAKVAGVLRLSDVDTLASTLDPLTEENPLGLGMFLMMLNAPTYECKGLGVDEVTTAAPEGTSVAWARAAALLEAEEVYALAPLTQDEVTQSMWWTHASVMSEPENGGERIVFINKKMPVRKNPTIAISGTSANTTSTKDQMLIDGNPAAGLIAAGINPAVEIPESDGVYMEFEVDGDLRRYNVESVEGALVNFRRTFTDPTFNLDGFYSTVELDPDVTPVLNAVYKVAVRGDSLIIPGSNPERLDYSLVADTVAAANAAINNRRCYSVFPDTIKTTVSGIEKSLPGYYACAAIAGMVGAQPPQQPFTNFPMAGLTGVVGTEKFTKKQLNTIAGGGTYILMQEAIGSPVTCRHQLSTQTDSIETRELSITKVVDFVAKFLRLSVRKFIGTHVINDGLLDSLGTTISAVLKFLEASGVLNGSNINNIMQDEENKDTVLVDVTLDVPFPCNYIRLTLVV